MVNRQCKYTIIDDSVKFDKNLSDEIWIIGVNPLHHQNGIERIKNLKLQVSIGNTK